MTTHRPAARPPRVARALMSLAMLAVPLGGAAQQPEDLFESNFDGSWVGTIEIGNALALMQLNVNAQGTDGVAFAVLPDNPGGAPTAVRVFSTSLTKVSAKKLNFKVDDADPLRAGTARFKLNYKSATDTVAGRSTGSIRGAVSLIRMDPALPLQKLWSGTVTMNGASEFLLFMFAEEPDAAVRFANSTVGGEAWVGDEQGTIVGQLNGKRLEATVALASGDYVISASLKTKNNKLNGTATHNGATGSLKLTSPVGNGKAMKFRSAAPKTVNAGESTAIRLKGSNLATGAVVHADNPDMVIQSVTLAGPKQLDVTVTPGADIADGTAVALRVVNADGQTQQRAAALTVSGSGGDDPAIVSFAASVQPIFTANCALSGCHDAATARAGMVLAAGLAFNSIVGVASSEQPSLMRINPGNAELSYLVRKIRGDSGISGGRMPLNRPPLTTAQIQTIIDWVNQGAANNSPPR